MGARPDAITGRTLCAAHCAGFNASQLRTAAGDVRTALPAAVVVLGGGAAPSGHVVVAVDGDVGDARLGRIGGAIAAWLGGRGGGRNGLFQGAVPTPERLASAPAPDDITALIRSAWSESSPESPEGMQAFTD